MAEIAQASRKIADITGVIDGNAFQTNILALNAAVEAARVGEQGRGFAVVASEMRALAQRSAQAAREIKGLIGDSVGKVETGSQLVGDAGRAMGDIVEQARRVNDLLSEISSATAEQTTGIGLSGPDVCPARKSGQRRRDRALGRDVHQAPPEVGCAASASPVREHARLTATAAGRYSADESTRRSGTWPAESQIGTGRSASSRIPTMEDAPPYTLSCRLMWF